MNKRILVIAAHPDDEIIGLGGTLAKFAANGYEIHSIILTDGHSGRSSGELTQTDLNAIQARKESALTAAKYIAAKSVAFGHFADQMLDTYPIVELTRFIESHLHTIKPHIVFTHHFGDANFDHQIIFKASLAALRPNPNLPLDTIYCYHTASSTEWGAPISSQVFLPNCFVDISDFWEQKKSALLAYESEMRPYPHPRSLQGLEELAAAWGKTIQVPKAEAFFIFRQIA